MRIVYYPDPVLEKRAEEIEEITPEILELVAGMLDAMVEARGIGLAAPQVGRSLRLFVASETGRKEDAIVCINPVVQPFGGIVEFEEGCLSIPDVHAQVNRPDSVRISYQRIDGSRVETEYDGLMARIIQHEFDHLDGVLFIQRMSDAEYMRIRTDLETLAAQYRG